MKRPGMNIVKDGIRIVNIAPVTIRAKQWYCVGFEFVDQSMGDFFHLLLIRADISAQANLYEGLCDTLNNVDTLLRIHSECILGDAFSSDLCDCGEQLNFTIKAINDRPNPGAILYLRQEGRGIGLRAKLACLSVQAGYENGEWTGVHMSSDAANLHYGFAVDQREYTIAGKILKAFNITRVELLTGNAAKIKALEDQQITIVSRKDTPFSYETTDDRKYREMLEKLSRGYVYDFKDELAYEQTKQS